MRKLKRLVPALCIRANGRNHEPDHWHPAVSGRHLRSGCVNAVELVEVRLVHLDFPTGDDMTETTTPTLQVGDAEKIKAALAAMPAEPGTSPQAHAKALIEAFGLVNAAERLSFSSSGR